MLNADEARELLDSIDTGTLIGLRDRALIAVMVYSFARVTAALGMKVEDYYTEGRRAWFRLHEKGGKRHEVPAHHNAEDVSRRLYRGRRHRRREESPPLPHHRPPPPAHRPAHAPHRRLTHDKGPAKAIGLPDDICSHTFRATGITAYLENGGTIEHAQQIATHESPEDHQALRPHQRPDHAR